MTSDPSTLSPTPVPAADTHSSHSLCPSPLALCLSQSRPVSIYLYLYRYEINYVSLWLFPKGSTVGIRVSSLSSNEPQPIVCRYFTFLLGCSHSKAVLIMDSQISVRGTQPYSCPIGLSETEVSSSHFSSCFLIIFYHTIVNYTVMMSIQIHELFKQCLHIFPRLGCHSWKNISWFCQAVSL